MRCWRIAVLIECRDGRERWKWSRLITWSEMRERACFYSASGRRVRTACDDLALARAMRARRSAVPTDETANRAVGRQLRLKGVA